MQTIQHLLNPMFHPTHTPQSHPRARIATLTPPHNVLKSKCTWHVWGHHPTQHTWLGGQDHAFLSHRQERRGVVAALVSSSYNVKGGIPSSQRYQPTYLGYSCVQTLCTACNTPPLGWWLRGQKKRRGIRVRGGSCMTPVTLDVSPSPPTHPLPPPPPPAAARENHLLAQILQATTAHPA